MQSKFTKSTDTQHKITLESAIISAAWSIAFGNGGAKAPFDIQTAFVGEGSKIKIKCKSEKGKTLAKISDVIYGNRYSGAFDLPEKLKLGDMIYFEVELSQLGLNEESNHIAAGPPINVTGMKWDKKEARRGDVLKLSADVTDVAEGTEVKVVIFEYDADGTNDKIVELPGTVKNKRVEFNWEYEYFEDTDEIPTDAELKKFGKNYNPPEYFFVIEINGQWFGNKQESGLLTFKDYIEIELKNEDGVVSANEKYILHLADGSERKGQLNAEGYAREENIPPGEIQVEFPDSKDYSSPKK
jgi:hypothetical protein